MHIHTHTSCVHGFFYSSCEVFVVPNCICFYLLSMSSWLISIYNTAHIYKLRTYVAHVHMSIWPRNTLQFQTINFNARSFYFLYIVKSQLHIFREWYFLVVFLRSLPSLLLFIGIGWLQSEPFHNKTVSLTTKIRIGYGQWKETLQQKRNYAKHTACVWNLWYMFFQLIVQSEKILILILVFLRPLSCASNIFWMSSPNDPKNERKMHEYEKQKWQ